MKFLTAGEAETKRHKAIDFLDRIGKDDLADEFEDISAEEYAQHKGATLIPQSIRGATRALCVSSKSRRRAAGIYLGID